MLYTAFCARPKSYLFVIGDGELRKIMSLTPVAVAQTNSDPQPPITPHPHPKRQDLLLTCLPSLEAGKCKKIGEQR